MDGNRVGFTGALAVQFERLGRVQSEMRWHVEQTIAIGKSGLVVPALGVGTWQWGDRNLWGYGRDYTAADVAAAYAASRAAGLTFFDTAEIYGRGTSERLLGEQVAQDPGPVVVATKFAPLPGRWTARRLAGALAASLARLGLARVDLYQIHFPYTLIPIESLMNALADQVEAGKARAVGVSNYSAAQMRRAHAALTRRGIPLASNQVHYSLLHRHPERNGVLAACRELNVCLIAYSPLEQGILTGKYLNGQRYPRRARGGALRRSGPLVAYLRQVGQAHGGKSAGQVALNWLIRQGALPIPGAKTATQAESNAGALGWSLTDEEFERIAAFRD
jgi:aryl-alcohol dehydrogenase-like predicted oxidoreductase